MNFIKKIHIVINDLKDKALQLDNKRGPHHHCLFDKQLFHCSATLLHPCVLEAEQTLHSLQHTSKSPEQTQFMADKLIQQIEAVQRELATCSLREQEPEPQALRSKPLYILNQELAQHQQWMQKLNLLVDEKTALFHSAPNTHKAQYRQVLNMAKQRVERCQTAILKLEKQITYRERHPNHGR